MKVTGLALVAPPGAADNPKVTPELLASSLARYSRSNKGIETILAAVDWSNPDKSVDAIFKFVDYGHASISGLTGGIAMTIDGCSMLLAYKLFEFAQLADGQESSTRYIALTSEALPTAEEVGIPDSLAGDWRTLMQRAFAAYSELYDHLDQSARDNPGLVRVPVGAGPKVADRLRRNYALDRARYLLPMACRTNVALVMSARMWAQVIGMLDSLPWPESGRCAQLLRNELQKFAPRLSRHTQGDTASRAQMEAELEFSRVATAATGAPTTGAADQVFVSVQQELPPFFGVTQSLPQSFDGKVNRYSLAGQTLRRMFVRFAWNNIALAELRDLNRHRTGNRFAPFTPVGFYLPPEVDRARPCVQEVLTLQDNLARRLAALDSGTPLGVHQYAFLLGVQTPFEHATQADKFIYEVELRTGLGAHFRYAEHLAAVSEEFLKQVPEARPFVQVGTAEPE